MFAFDSVCLLITQSHLYTFNPVTWLNFHHVTLVLPTPFPLYHHQSEGGRLTTGKTWTSTKEEGFHLTNPWSWSLKSPFTLPWLSHSNTSGLRIIRKIVGNFKRVTDHDIVIVLSYKDVSHSMFSKRTELLSLITMQRLISCCFPD